MVRKEIDRLASSAPGKKERIDRLGSEIVRASSMNEVEVEEVATLPFLFTRIRSRIADEARRREEKESWLSYIIVFWRAVPAMALVAVFCLVLFLSSSSGGLVTAGLTEDGMPSAPESGIERAVFAERQSLSDDDVLTTIMVGEDGEATK